MFVPAQVSESLHDVCGTLTCSVGMETSIDIQSWSRRLLDCLCDAGALVEEVGRMELDAGGTGDNRCEILEEPSDHEVENWGVAYHWLGDHAWGYVGRSSHYDGV